MLSLNFLVYNTLPGQASACLSCFTFCPYSCSTDLPSRTIWTFHPQLWPLPFLSLFKRLTPLIIVSADSSSLLPAFLVLAAIIAFIP